MAGQGLGGLRTEFYVKISEPPKLELGVWISWRIFALSLCLHGVADRGQTAEERAAANAAMLEEGEKKQRFLKIVEALQDHLKSHPWL